MGPREWRKAEKVTAQVVADKLGCSIPSLYNYENGNRDAPNRIVRAFEKISNGRVTSDDLHAVRARWLRKQTKVAA